MKTSQWELDPEGDVELVLGFDKPTPSYDAELGWLHKESKRERKKAKKRAKKKRLIDAFPEPPETPSIDPEPVVAEPMGPADDPSAEPDAVAVEPPKEPPDEPAEPESPPIASDHPLSEDGAVVEREPEVEAVAEEEPPQPEMGTLLEPIPEDEVPPEPAASPEQAAVPDAEAVPEGGAALEPEISLEPEAALDEAEPPKDEEAAAAAEEEDAPPAEADPAEPIINDLNHATSDEAPEPPAEAALSPKSEPEEYQFKLLVSSHHLRIASPVFRKMLDEPAEESNNESQSQRRIVINGWDPDALLMVMDVIHGHHRDVPRAVTLKTLVDIAVIVDHYKCHEVLEIFGEIWLRPLESSHPNFHGKESVVFMFLAWVFSDQSLFKKMTKLAILKCEGFIDTMLLPIPDKILVDILMQRGRLLSELLDIPYQAVERLLAGDDLFHPGQGFESSGLLLGCLLKEMHAKGLPLSKPQNFSWDFSVHHFKQTILGFKAPSSVSYRHADFYGSEAVYGLEAPVRNVLKDLEGFNVEDYASFHTI